MKNDYARLNGEWVEIYSKTVIRCFECNQFMTREEHSCGHDCEA